MPLYIAGTSNGDDGSLKLHNRDVFTGSGNVLLLEPLESYVRNLMLSFAEGVANRPALISRSALTADSQSTGAEVWIMAAKATSKTEAVITEVVIVHHGLPIRWTRDHRFKRRHS